MCFSAHLNNQFISFPLLTRFCVLERLFQYKINNFEPPQVNLKWKLNTVNLALFKFLGPFVFPSLFFFGLKLRIILLGPQINKLVHNFIIKHFIKFKMAFLGICN